jgi:hypothetical protein
VIELHRNNLTTCVETRRNFVDAYGDHEIKPLAGLVIGNYPGGGSRAVGPVHPAIRGIFDPYAKPPLVANNKWEIEANAGCLPESEQLAWIEQKFDELRALVERQCAEVEESPRGIAWRAYDDACMALTNSMERLIAARPTTIAGVSAALDCWLEFVEADTGMEVVGDEGDTINFLTGLAEAVRAIA